MIFKKKHLYKILYKSDKTIKITKVKNINNENILINPNHIYFDKNGNRYILTTDQSAESINPLDFESKFSPKEFRSAIESKLIQDLFKTFDDKKLPIDRLLLFVNIFMTFVILYFMIMRR
ncbi:MAG: hypothetical protein QXN68_05040 [Thermoplasmata archaeon]